MSVPIEIILAVIGSNAIFSFLTFLITRKDNKNNRIDDLEDALKKGLDEREQTGKNRYLEHQESIKKLNEAIIQLTKNDTEMKEYMHDVGDGIVGLGHDKLIYLTDKYQARGKITLKEKANLTAIYVPYHNLGGNGDAKLGYEYAMNLPTIKEEEAWEIDRKGVNK